jgi:hypothetical protein
LFRDVATPLRGGVETGFEGKRSTTRFLIGFAGLLEYNLNERINLMKKLISYTVTALFATIAISFAAPENNKEAIISKEKAAWQAFKDKKSDDFKKLLSADLVAVYSNGILTLQKELEAMAKTEMQSFDLSDFNVVFPDPGTAIISYKAKVQSTSEGKDTSGTYNNGSVWRMIKGQWRAIFHTDMKEEPAAQPAG